MNIGYRDLFDKIMRDGFGDPRSRVSVEIANEAWEHPDHDLGVVRTTAGKRCAVVIEGERELVGPMIEDIRRRLESTTTRKIHAVHLVHPDGGVDTPELNPGDTVTIRATATVHAVDQETIDIATIEGPHATLPGETTLQLLVARDITIDRGDHDPAIAALQEIAAVDIDAPVVWGYADVERLRNIARAALKRLKRLPS